MTMIVVKNAKLGTTRTYDSEKLPAASRDFALAYGMQQKSADRHAPIVAKNFATRDAWLAAVRAEEEATHKAWLDGTIGERSARSEKVAMLEAQLAEAQALIAKLSAVKRAA